ncbi:MAG: hypothetical protein ACR2MT_05770 [Aurantibacter sp.]
MKKALLSLIFLMLFALSYAQTKYTINGTITDAETGEFLIDGNVGPFMFACPRDNP